MWGRECYSTRLSGEGDSGSGGSLETRMCQRQEVAMIKSILVPIDFSDVTDTVLSVASRFAKAFDAKIVLTHVAKIKVNAGGLELCPKYMSDNVGEQLAEQDHVLHEHEKALRAQGLDVTAILDSGPPDQQVAEETESLKPDLVIVGSHGHGAFHHLLTSSVCESVMKHAMCPVVIVPMKTPPTW